MPTLFDSLGLLLESEPHPAPLNMAIDEVLLRGCERPILRIYQWIRPAVSFGYFEKFGPVPAAHPGRELVRRWTGGGVVLHGEDLTYSLIVPAGTQFLRLRTAESYRAIHERIAKTMNLAGIAVSMAGADDEKISHACFENAARHDILRRGRKIAGAAQRRARPGLLHQGSIQCPGLPADFGETLAASFSPRITIKKISADEASAAHSLAANKYATETWTRKF